MNLRLFIALSALAVLLLFAGQPSYVFGQATVTVMTKVHPEYARITFAWKERVQIKSHSEGKRLSIIFTQPMQGSVSQLTTSLNPYVVSANVSEDKKTVSLTLDKPYRIRNFLSGNANGVDILGTDASRHKGLASSSKTNDTAKKAVKTPEKKPDHHTSGWKVAPAVTKPSTIKTNTDNVKKDEASSSSVPLPVAKPEVPVKNDSSTPKTKEKEVVEASALADVQGSSEATEKEKKATKEIVKPTPKKVKKMTVTVAQKRIFSEFYFPWKERTAAAAFIRGSYVWIVFNREANINLALLNSIMPPYLKKAETLQANGHTILRIKLNNSAYVTTRKKKDSYEWVVTISRRSKLPTHPITTTVKTKPPLKPHLMIPVLQTADVLDFIDPAFGDQLSIIPLYAAGKGLFPERKFVDFTLLRTGQGIVVKKLDDKTRVVKLRNGLRITKPKTGVTLSASLPDLDMEQYITAEESSHTFFPYEDWKAEDAQAFVSRKQQLQNAITDANDKQANALRTELVKLYLAEGMHSEALGLLNQIKARDADFYDIYQLAALRGATNFMMSRIGEASADFQEPSLEGEDEIGFWQRATSVMMGQENRLIKFLYYDKQYGKFYPPQIRQKLAIIAADQLLGRGKYDSIFKILDILAADKQYDSIKDESDYMVARILAGMGKKPEAIDKLKALVDETSNRFVQVRAEFALATMEYEAGDITRKELVDRLNRIRMLWRGDGLELSVLNLLGELQILEENYLEGLRAWKEILTHFPETVQASDIAGRMAELFVELFNGGRADVMEPLEALSLYYEFRELTPIERAGDLMIQNLADRLAQVDLLDRAAALLRHQVKFRLEKEERSRVGSRLALLHLFNRQPKAALEVLELTGYGDSIKSLKTNRNHLAAMAYADLGNWEKALNILKEDFTEDAKMVRLDIFWENKDWGNVIITAEDMLANRPDITAPLNEMEAQILLKLAVAYTFEQDMLQLQYLHDYFTPLMEGNPLKDRFTFITNDTTPIDHKNITKLAKDISEIKSFVDNYRTRVQEEGLSSIN